MGDIGVHFVVAQKLYDYTVNNKSDAVAGVLLGYYSPKTLYVLGSCTCKSTSAQGVVELFKKVPSYVSAGISACGIFFRSEQANVPVIIEQVCQKILPDNLEESLGTDSVLVCVIPKRGKASDVALYWYSGKKLTAVNLNSVEKNFDEPIILRLKATLPLSFRYNTKKEIVNDNLDAEIRDIENKLLSNSSVFQVEETDVLLHHTDACLTTSLGSEARCSELLTYLKNYDGNRDVKGKSTKQQVIKLTLLNQISGDRALEGTLACTPVINHDLEESVDVKLNMPLDVTALVSKDNHVYSIPSLLLDGVVYQLQQFKECIVNHTVGQKFFMPKVYHFRPAGLNHIVTVVYPEGKDDKALENDRHNLHEMFMIKPEKPTFKKLQVLRFPDEESSSIYLENPHLGLGPSGVKDGKVFCVDGTYTYHHYMQDRFDDDKWGCAYRSLQTLVSWFRYQGYTDVAIPTHKQIQQALVDIGDKEASFVNSRKWIGSTEVSYVLDHLLGVTSKILFVNSGAELGNKGRELSIHFQTQGTPIMIGGGVLAHTILGVDFSESSGELKFLILDPHYTGAENMKTIRDKGWCGWKGPEFWDKNAYYNLCMPQRPSCI